MGYNIFRGYRRKRNVAIYSTPKFKAMEKAYYMGKKDAAKSANRRTGGYRSLELKYKDHNLADHILTENMSNAATNADPSSTVCLNCVDQGTGQSQRLGLRMRVKSIHVKCIVRFQIAASLTPQDTIRLLLVLDKQTNGATLSATDVLNNISGTTHDICAHTNLENSSRFQILADKIVKDDNTNHYYDGTTVARVKKAKVVHLYKSFGKRLLTTKFLSTGATTADIADNSIHLIAIASQTGGGTALSYESRLRYYGD